MNLETSDGFRLACSANSVNSLTNFDGDFNILELLVEGDEHSWVHGEDQVIQEVVVLTANEEVHISSSVQHSQDTGKTDIREEELVRVHWRKTEHTFSKMDETLCNSYYK